MPVPEPTLSSFLAKDFLPLFKLISRLHEAHRQSNRIVSKRGFTVTLHICSPSLHIYIFKFTSLNRNFYYNQGNYWKNPFGHFTHLSASTWVYSISLEIFFSVFCKAFIYLGKISHLLLRYFIRHLQKVESTELNPCIRLKTRRKSSQALSSQVHYFSTWTVCSPQCPGVLFAQCLVTAKPDFKSECS